MRAIARGWAAGLAGGLRAWLPGRRRHRPAAWQRVDEGWWCAEAGALEVHLRREPELGWQVELRDPLRDAAVCRPTFSPRLEDACRVALYFFARYGRAAPSGRP